MNKNKNQYQQGDVLLKKIENVDLTGGKVIAKKKCILAHGEVTGHYHIVEDDEAELIQLGDKILLKLEKQSTLYHQEHKPINLDPGVWHVGQVVEEDEFGEMQAVRD